MVCAFYACLYVGAIPVLVRPPQQPRNQIPLGLGAGGPGAGVGGSTASVSSGGAGGGGGGGVSGLFGGSSIDFSQPLLPGTLPTSCPDPFRRLRHDGLECRLLGAGGRLSHTIVHH